MNDYRSNEITYKINVSCIFPFSRNINISNNYRSRDRDSDGESSVIIVYREFELTKRLNGRSRGS